MPPAGAARHSDIAVRGLADSDAATARLALRPPQTLARDPDPKRQAVAALVDLLTAALDRKMPHDRDHRAIAPRHSAGPHATPIAG
jgi:hypothetical protein